MAHDSTEERPQESLRGSYSPEQIRRSALSGLADSAKDPQLIALLKHHRDASREALGS
jgi:hypothetical protein